MIIKMSARQLKWLLNCYPPYLGAGIRVDRIASDWKRIDVSMKLRWFTRNAVGTHFGGSLYSMTDPHYMLMLMKILGPGYIVWDKSASIDFLKPGKGRVRASFSIDEEEIQRIKNHVEKHSKILPQYTVPILDEEGVVVANVHKELYIRRKRIR